MPKGIYKRSDSQKQKLREIGKKNATHGLSSTRFYSIWRGMVRRCTDSRMTGYEDYGGKGIKVCDSWLDFISFKEAMYKSYLEHIEQNGEKNTTIDRIDSALGYEIKNCRWLTYTNQNRNRLNNKILEYKGQKKTLIEWAEQFNLLKTTLRERLLRGWSIEKALETKPRTYATKKT